MIARFKFQSIQQFWPNQKHYVQWPHVSRTLLVRLIWSFPIFWPLQPFKIIISATWNMWMSYWPDLKLMHNLLYISILSVNKIISAIIVHWEIRLRRTHRLEHAFGIIDLSASPISLTNSESSILLIIMSLSQVRSLRSCSQTRSETIFASFIASKIPRYGFNMLWRQEKSLYPQLKSTICANRTFRRIWQHICRFDSLYGE
jgi:hypothetical protein